jgi:hypothetical protein
MMNPGQIRGMLLEEAVLHLLRRSGYRTVDAPGADPTLCNVGAGLAVRGRGCEHQIDALADFVVHQPFSNPQRLMVEAKCYGSHYKVGIEVVRNAIGVLKDTSEFWIAGPGPIAGRSRYHYQYAVFSASEFTAGAQRFAFAQDVYLFPLDRSRFFRPILDAIRQIVPVGLVPGRRLLIGNPRQLSEFRSFVRAVLRREVAAPEYPAFLGENGLDVGPLVAACRQLNFALVAVLGGRFPVLLSPSLAVQNRILEDQTRVRIFWNEEGWYLMDGNNEVLFSFDLPDELFELYAEEGFLAPGRALDLKQQMMSTFQAVETVDGRARLISFTLDHDWIAAIRRRIN